jgi:hypothetical protein
MWLSNKSNIENDNKSNNEINSDEYYVKYEVNSSTKYIGYKLNVIYTNDKGNNNTIIVNSGSWEGIIGPVKKYFNAKLNVKCDTDLYGTLKLYTQISISKNGSPFALKNVDGSEIPRSSVFTNYQIDY